MVQLGPFVPQEVCLACQGCCRYAEQESVWQPFFMFDEIAQLTEKGIVPARVFARGHNRKGKGARINLIWVGDSFFCPCLEICENKCKIYGQRPLDCQLYPFLLTRKEDQAYIAVDRKCPYVQKMRKTSPFGEFVEKILDFFASEDSLRLANNNPEIFQIYGQDSEFLAPLPGLRPRHYGIEAAFPDR